MNEELNPILPGEESAPAGEEAAAQEKPDLFDYLESLPDVEDPFEPSEPEEETEPEEPSDLELLAQYIRGRSVAGVLTAKKPLIKDSPELEEVLSQLTENSEEYADIRVEEGKKDLYFYSTPAMAVNYAHMAMLAEEKDHCRTIADIVRWNCKVGPACTMAYFFISAPYNMTKTQIDVTLDLMKKREEYADIQETTSFNGKRYLYTTNRLSAKYAKALADFAEEGEHNM